MNWSEDSLKSSVITVVAVHRNTVPHGVDGLCCRGSMWPPTASSYGILCPSVCSSILAAELPNEGWVFISWLPSAEGAQDSYQSSPVEEERGPLSTLTVWTLA